LTCTWANTTIPGQQVTSPVNGVVVRWRIRAAKVATGGIDVRLKVIRPVGSGYQSVNTSATTTLAASGADTTYEIPTTQPIAAGDQIALDMGGGFASSNTHLFTPPIPGVTRLRWEPSLADGETRDPTFTFLNTGELMLNADVEPDCDGDGFGDETQDADTSSCNPPPGDLAAPNTTITKAPKNKTRKKRATFTFSGTDVRVLAGFQCSLDGAAFASCTSPHKVKVKKGKHTFAVRAVDQAGNVDATPATDRWKVKKKRKRK
jgi:hypothetical protein